MMDMTAIQEFLGWCSLINVGLLTFSAVVVVWLRGPISRIHAKMFALEPDGLPRVYFEYLALYKIAIIIFNIVPYVALRIIA
jgi:hypothetical protein